MGRVKEKHQLWIYIYLDMMILINGTVMPYKVTLFTVSCIFKILNLTLSFITVTLPEHLHVFQ